MRGIGVASVTAMNDRLGGYDRKVLCLLRAPIPRTEISVVRMMSSPWPHCPCDGKENFQSIQVDSPKLLLVTRSDQEEQGDVSVAGTGLKSISLIGNALDPKGQRRSSI